MKPVEKFYRRFARIIGDDVADDDIPDLQDALIMHAVCLEFHDWGTLEKTSPEVLETICNRVTELIQQMAKDMQ